MSRPPKTTRPRLFYGYIIVGAAACIQIIAWGLFDSYGVFFNSISVEFNWSRETISGAFSLSQMFIGIGAIFLGSLNDRFGPRLLMTCGGIIAGLGFVLISQVGSVWQLYLIEGVVVGIGLSGTDVVLLSVVARWFVKRRGIMSGIVKMGTGIGIMAMPNILAWLISVYEWRNTSIILGITLFIVVVGLTQLLRRDPGQMKLFPDGAQRLQPIDVQLFEEGQMLSQAARTRQFWMLCGSYFIIQFSTNSMIVHVAPFAIDLKLGTSFAAAMVSAIGGASIVGRFLVGFFSDRIGCRRALLACFIIFIAALSWLQMVRSSWSLALFTLVFGFAHGGFYALISPLVAEFFGMRFHGKILGIVIFAASLGGSIGPIISGRIFDNLASYRIAFLIMLGLAVIGLVMALLQRKLRKPTTNSGDIQYSQKR